MAGSNERAILAGGCFWGMQDLLRSFPGVITTRVGYTGGNIANATYRNHEGHAEAIEIVFDPQQLTYRRLLEFFFQIHDPTTLNRQVMTPGQVTARRSFSRQTNRSGLRKTQSRTSTPRISGLARSRPK
jgi:methionine-S-sulfoxide reductase